MLAFRKNVKSHRGELTYVDVVAISANPKQPRSNISDEELQGLVDSVRTYGVIQPVTLRRRERGYELIAGERRLRAARKAGLLRIPAIIIDCDDRSSALLALVENEQRQDLHFFDEAEAIYHLLTQGHMTQEQLAGALGKNQSTIANKLRLLRFGDSFRQRIREARLTERHARTLLKLNNAEDMDEVLSRVIENNLTVKETEEAVEGVLLAAPNPTNKTKTTEERKFFFVLRDYKPMLNTIKKTVSEMKKAGVDACYTERECDDGGYEIILRLPGNVQ